MWNHRNEILHNQENNIAEQQHNDLNKTINQIYRDLPNMRLLTAAERRFFKFATRTEVQGRNIHRKKQWIRKANSILNTFETKQHKTEHGAVQILLQAMKIQENLSEKSEQSNLIPKTKQKTIQKQNKKYQSSLQHICQNNQNKKLEGNLERKGEYIKI